ncbi:MAG TPA: energy transducer TonB [Bacteroidetes bacterium]|nr:energy transducer TonB [Bacteroidota bacterium]
MNFEFTTMQSVLLIIFIAILVIAIIFFFKYYLNRKKDFKELYKDKKLSSPLVARNKYPEVDPFKLRKNILLFGLVASLAVIFIVFNWTTYEKKMDLSGYDLVVDEDFEIEPPRTAEPPKPPPPPPPPVIEEVPEEEILDDEEQPEFQSQDVSEDDVVEAPPEDTTKAAPPPPPPPPPPKEEEIFQIVEQMPRFPGCEDKATKAEKEQCSQQKLMEYIYANLKYPPIARENGIEGRAVIRFVVDKNGKVSDVKILRDIGGGCGEAAAKVIKSMNSMSKKWVPGRQGGRKVKVYYTLPVIFKLTG